VALLEARGFTARILPFSILAAVSDAGCSWRFRHHAYRGRDTGVSNRPGAGSGPANDGEKTGMTSWSIEKMGPGIFNDGDLRRLFERAGDIHHAISQVMTPAAPASRRRLAAEACM